MTTRVKTGVLGVDAALLDRHGAVSEEVALAMARGARERLDADVGVGITGVAGPGSEGVKPAGLVYVAIASPGGERVEASRRRPRSRGEPRARGRGGAATPGGA